MTHPASGVYATRCTFCIALSAPPLCHLLFDLQGFHSSDSDDQHSDDEEDHVEGMSGDEQMGEQQDFEGSDSFDEVCNLLRIESSSKVVGGIYIPECTM